MYFPNFILLNKDVENTTYHLLSTPFPKRRDILTPRKVRKTQSKIKDTTLLKIHYTILVGYRHFIGKDCCRYTKINNNKSCPKEN